MSDVRQSRTRIFVTVGAQLPFDRLIRAVDKWLGTASSVEAFAQVGDTRIQCRQLVCVRYLTHAEFQSRMSWADAIVGHAGMGTIISAMAAGKPVLVLPRRAAYGETRNDHQVATARRFRDLNGVRVAMTEEELASHLSVCQTWSGGAPLSSVASAELVNAIRDFVRSDRAR